MWRTKMDCRDKWSLGVVVEEFTREREVAGSKPCNDRLGGVAAGGTSSDEKKNDIFLPLFSWFLKIYLHGRLQIDL